MVKKQLTFTERLVQNIYYIPVIILALIMIIPFYWMVLGAFKSVEELKRVPPTLTIENPTLDNFHDPDADLPDHVDGLFQRYTRTDGGFMRFYANSVFVAVVNTVLSLMVASLAAYVFAKHRFPGRNTLFLLVLGSMMIPWQVTILPNYLIVDEIGWLNTFEGLIIPALPRAFALFFLRQYMLSIPDDLIDAARVDGANEFLIWWRVVLPLTIPAMVAMGLFVYLGNWNNLVWPLMITSGDMRTLPVVMSTMVDPYSAGFDQGVSMAAALIVSLPTIIIFLFFQKQFVQGIALTGLKG